MTQVNEHDWNEFLQGQKDVSILQSSEWGSLKSAFGWDTIRFVAEGTGAQILFRKIFPGISFAYIPKGPVGTGTPTFFQELDEICQQRNAFFLHVEPDAWEGSTEGVLDQGFQKVARSIQPRRTIVIDLIGTEDEWLARMKQKTRYNIRLAQKKGVEVNQTSDVAIFYKLMTLTSQRDQFGAHSQAYYQKVFDLFKPAGNCQLFVAQLEGEPLAAIMVFAYRGRAYYFYGASGNDRRNLMPNYALQWEAMRWASQQGCTLYDMWGIPDEDEEVLEGQFDSRTDGLWPVYRFKRGFGGKVIRSASPQDKVYNPLLYRIFRRWIS
jgi:lipid II:glycine glycyltransferase (peptidoglycan interpeptide bridge formation enzyme)